MWELDSSAPAKWSRHVVIRLPGAALRDTAVAGALVARLLARPEVLTLTYLTLPPSPARAPGGAQATPLPWSSWRARSLLSCPGLRLSAPALCKSVLAQDGHRTAGCQATC